MDKRRIPAFLTILFFVAFFGVAINCADEEDEDDDHSPDDGDQDDDHDDDSDDDQDDDTDDDDLSESIGLEWVEIPAGDFTMGCSAGDEACRADEQPAHPVTLAAFAMNPLEITQTQFNALLGVNPSYFTTCDDCPVEQVSWEQATAFCALLDARLPTEAEWEYAARAGASTKYSCGDDEACLTGIAWFLDDADLQTHPVGLKDPNDFGLYDLHGNVWEWVNDWYDADYYAASPAVDPAGPNASQWRVLRGGGWNNTADYLRVSYRNYDPPTDRDRVVGFRCVRDAAAVNEGGTEE